MALYDESHNERPRNVFEAHLARPFKKAVDIVRNRVNKLSVRMASQAFLDQYPARSVPYIYSKLYGPFGLLAPRRNGQTGLLGLGPVVDLGAFATPRNSNIVVNREGPFYWCSTNATAYVTLTGGGLVVPAPVLPAGPAGDIFDPVFTNNGGGVSLNSFDGPFVWDYVLYDRKRGRRLHDDHMPPQVITAQNYANKENATPIRFDPNTEIEPRVRLLSVNPIGPAVDDSDAVYNDAVDRTAVFLNIMFIGYKVLGD